MFGIINRKPKRFLPYLEVVEIIYSHLVLIDFGFQLQERKDIIHALQDLEKIAKKIPYPQAQEILQDAINSFYVNHGRPVRLPGSLIEIYGLENAEDFWVTAEQYKQ